jgi:hypothetical protein
MVFKLCFTGTVKGSEAQLLYNEMGKYNFHYLKRHFLIFPTNFVPNLRCVYFRRTSPVINILPIILFSLAMQPRASYGLLVHDVS